MNTKNIYIMNKSEGRNFIKINKFKDNTSVLRFNLLSLEQRNNLNYKNEWDEAQVRCAGGNCKKVLKVKRNEEGWNLQDWSPYIRRAYVSAAELRYLAYSVTSIVEFYCRDCDAKEIEKKPEAKL